MPLPRSDRLSLSETVAFVAKHTGERAAKVRAALIEAALEGAIIATGHHHMSALYGAPEYFDGARGYFDAPLSPRTDVRPEYWGDEISWRISRVGRCSQVRFELAEIERWLGAAAPEPHARASHDAPEPEPAKRDEQRAPTKRAAFANWITEEYPDGIPPGTTVKALAQNYKKDRGVSVSERTARRALGRK